MTTRFVVWHIPQAGVVLPTYYIDRACQPVALRLYAETAPNGGDLLVDVLDDSASIMNSNNRQKVAFKDEDGYIEYGTPVGTFQVNETITGGTSGATARVKAQTKSRITVYDNPATAFTVAETITGGTSAATGVVDAYVKQVKNWTPSVVAGQARANLPKSKTSNEAAQDFQPSIEIAEGSWLSFKVLEYNGAQNITAQLELEDLAESVERRPGIGGM